MDELKTKIKHISSIIFNILIQNKMALYDKESNFENEDLQTKEFENLQIKKYKAIVDKWIKDSEIDNKIREYILLEKDPYGLQTGEINLVNDINDSLFDLEREIIVNSLEIKDIKENILFKKYNEEISKLKLDIEEINKVKENIEIKLSKSESEKKEINNILKIKDKRMKEISHENELLRNKIEAINFEEMKNSKIKEEELQKEINYYKSLLNKAKEMKLKNDKEISNQIDFINKLNKQLEDIKNDLNSKDDIIKNKEKEIKNLKIKLTQVIELSKTTEIKNKMTLSEFNSISNKIKLEIRDYLTQIVRNVKGSDRQSIMASCNDVYKTLSKIQSRDSIEEGLSVIEQSIELLADVKKKCDKNQLNNDLEKGIEKLYELKNKII